MDKIRKKIDALLIGKISAINWLVIFLGIVVIRLFLDNFVAKSFSSEIILEMDLQNFLFFGLTFFLIWAFLSLILKKKPSELALLMIWASLFIDLPPILDLIKTRGEIYVEPYLYSSLAQLKMQYLTIFGHLPSGVVYFGTRISFILAVLGIFLVVLIKTRNWFKALASLVGTYSILFFMASFPSWLTFAYYFLEGSKKLTEIGSVQIIQLLSFAKNFSIQPDNFEFSIVYNLNLVYFILIVVVTSLLFFLSARQKFWAVLRNSRFPQIMSHAGLFFIGMGLGYLAYPDNFQLGLFPILAVLCLILSLIFSWLASVIFNDICDLETDQITNVSRPLVEGVFEKKEYQELGIIFFVLALLGAISVEIKFVFIMLTYQIIACFYSNWPFRLKRFPVLATFLSSLALMLALFMGFTLLSGSENLQNIQWRVVFLLMFTFTLSLPLKDFKDIEGDRKMGVWTIPVIFGEELGRIIVGAGIFISFVSSIFFLNERDLFFWAVIFGAIAFLIVVSEKIKTRQLIWWILPCVIAYGLILVKIALLS
jgi:4-hydroxybenzoate polyprenyltransferase